MEVRIKDLDIIEGILPLLKAFFLYSALYEFEQVYQGYKCIHQDRKKGLKMPIPLSKGKIFLYHIQSTMTVVDP